MEGMKPLCSDATRPTAERGPRCIWILRMFNVCVHPVGQDEKPEPGETEEPDELPEPGETPGQDEFAEQGVAEALDARPEQDAKKAQDAASELGGSGPRERDAPSALDGQLALDEPVLPMGVRLPHEPDGRHLPWQTSFGPTWPRIHVEFGRRFW